MNEPDGFKDAVFRLQLLEITTPHSIQGKHVATKRHVPSTPPALAIAERNFRGGVAGESQLLLASGEVIPLPRHVNSTCLIGICFAIYVTRDKQHRGNVGWTSALLIQYQEMRVLEWGLGG